MKSGKNWSIVNGIVELAGLALGIFGIFTGMKAASYNEEQQYKALEDRYGLTPVEKKETEGGED